MNARFSGLVKKVQNCSQAFILATHISPWTSFLLILLRKEHSTSEMEQHEKNPNKSISWSHTFFIHFWCINWPEIEIKCKSSQILHFPYLSQSSCTRLNPGDPHRTSNISHKTQQNRKSARETRNVLLLTKAGRSLLKFSKKLRVFSHFSACHLHDFRELWGLGFFHMVTDSKRVSAGESQHSEMSFLPLYRSLLNLDCLFQVSVSVHE